MAEGGSSRLLGIWGKRSAHLDPFVGERIETGDGLLALCPLLHENAEVLHVTFDSVLRERTPEERWRFFDRLTDLLRAHPAAHAANLEAHFLRHLKPFVRHPARAGAVP